MSNCGRGNTYYCFSCRHQRYCNHQNGTDIYNGSTHRYENSYDDHRLSKDARYARALHDGPGGFFDDENY